MHHYESMRDRRYLGVEGLRFVLALIVVFYHYYFFGPLNGDIISLSASRFPGLSFGQFGVEAFFIISGFVIAISAQNKNSAKFASARFIRLSPVLFATSTITFAAVSLFHDPVIGHVKVIRYISSILVLPIAMPMYHPFLDPSLWSLTYEIRFYAFIAVALLFGRIERSILPLSALLLAIDTASLLAGKADHYIPWFVIGMLLFSVFYQRRHTVSVYALLVWATVMSCIRASWEYSHVRAMLHFPPGSPLTGPFIALVILAVVLLSLHLSRYPLPEWLKIFGAMSYPLYAVHQLLGFWLINLFTIRFGFRSFDVRPFVVLFMIALSYVLAQHFEVWAREYYRRAERAIWNASSPAKSQLPGLNQDRRRGLARTDQ